MLFENPDDDRRAREAFKTLTDLTENNAEFYLIVSVIRMFHQVKAEYREKARQRNYKPLTIVKH